MKYSMVFSAVLMALALSACDRPFALTPAAVATAPVPGPADPTGATGLTESLATTASGMFTDASLAVPTPVTSADSSTGLQGKANPQGVMTRQEESMAMPKPGQANDHSSPALHPPR